MSARVYTFPEIDTAETAAPWRDITDAEVREAIAGTALVPIVEAFESVAVPPLPLAATLPRAIVLAGCGLSGPVANYDPEDETDIRRGVELCRLQIATAHGQACNAWHLLVAESGSGKDVGGVLDRLAGRLGWSLGTAGSGEGLADAFTEIGNGLLSVAEFSPWLDARHWQAKATGWLTAAFNRGWFKVNLSRRTGGTRESRFCFPNIAANIQPEVLAQHATAINMASGFLPRFLFTCMDRGNWRPATDPRGDLLNGAESALRQYHAQGGIVRVPEAYLQHLQDMFHECDAPCPAHWQRLVNEYGPRLAVMLAVPIEDAGHPGITLSAETWDRVAVLLQWFYSHGETALASVAEDERSAKYERILGRFYRYIDRHGPVMLADISRNCGKGTTAFFRLKLLEELVSRELVVKQDEGTYSTTTNPPPRDWKVGESA